MTHNTEQILARLRMLPHTAKIKIEYGTVIELSNDDTTTLISEGYYDVDTLVEYLVDLPMSSDELTLLETGVGYNCILGIVALPC